MAWEGDPPGSGAPIPHNVFGGPMPTAICRIYTREGFLIAADGRKIIIADGRLETREDTQKIFRLETSGGPLAYSHGGTSGLGPKEGAEILFSFARKTSEAAKRFKARPDSLYKYAGMLATSLYRSLLAIHRTGRLAPFDPGSEPDRRGDTIVWIFLDGYYNGVASRANLRFFHENQILLPPEVFQEDLQTGEPVGYGSLKLFNEVFRTDNPHFATCRKPRLLSDEVTLDYARKMAEGYIRAFALPEAQRIDPWACMSVGPRIHTATVTQAAGFNLGPWI